MTGRERRRIEDIGKTGQALGCKGGLRVEPLVTDGVEREIKLDKESYAKVAT